MNNLLLKTLEEKNYDLLHELTNLLIKKKMTTVSGIVCLETKLDLSKWIQPKIHYDQIPMKHSFFTGYNQLTIRKHPPLKRTGYCSEKTSDPILIYSLGNGTLKTRSGVKVPLKSNGIYIIQGDEERSLKFDSTTEGGYSFIYRKNLTH